MPVSKEMRTVEAEIDEEIQSLPVWKNDRAQVLEGLMEIYRDNVGMLHVCTLNAKLLDNANILQSAGVYENFIRNGVLWALKWATVYCPEARQNAQASPEELCATISHGQNYDALVDILSYAEKDLATLSVNRKLKEIICYEGENLTGFDAAIVEQERAFGPTHVHVTLTEDSDQLTSNWCAGDYRRVTRNLAKIAMKKEIRIKVNPILAERLGIENVPITRPTLVWLKRPKNGPDVQVFDSLTLPSKLTDKSLSMWRARSFLENPIVKVADERFCALSSDLKAIAGIDDYMLRLAARLDKNQYSKVSGLREERMIKFCRLAFEGDSNPWQVRSGVKLTNPPQEVDIIASRMDESLVIELKSTLRPETIREVYNKNSDVLKGVNQAKSLVKRGIASRGLLITDGYRGDFRCWEEALNCGIIIGTLHEIEELARDPNGAIQQMKRRVGVGNGERDLESLPDREEDLLGWKLRLIDAPLSRTHETSN